MIGPDKESSQKERQTQNSVIRYQSSQKSNLTRGVEKRSLTKKLELGGLVKLRKIERSLIQASKQKETSPLPIIHFKASANF